MKVNCNRFLTVHNNQLSAYVEEAVSFQLLHDHWHQNCKYGTQEMNIKRTVITRGLLIMGEAMHILENTVNETPLAAAR